MELNTILKAIKLNVPNFVVQNILNESLKSEKKKNLKTYLFIHTILLLISKICHGGLT